MAKLTTKFVTKVQSDNIKVFWDDQLKGFGLCVRPFEQTLIFKIGNWFFESEVLRKCCKKN